MLLFRHCCIIQMMVQLSQNVQSLQVRMMNSCNICWVKRNHLQQKAGLVCVLMVYYVSEMENTLSVLWKGSVFSKFLHEPVCFDCHADDWKRAIVSLRTPIKREPERLQNFTSMFVSFRGMVNDVDALLLDPFTLFSFCHPFAFLPLRASLKHLLQNDDL